MIVNPDNFQAIVIDKMKNSYRLNFSQNEINSVESVTLLGIEIDNQLNFDSQVSSLCKKATGQSNALSRIQHFMGTKERVVIIKSSIICKFQLFPTFLTILF